MDGIGSDRTRFVRRAMDAMLLPGISKWGATRQVRRLERIYDAPGIEKNGRRERPNTIRKNRLIGTYILQIFTVNMWPSWPRKARRFERKQVG